MEIINFSRVGIPKTNQFIFNNIYILSKFASKVSPKVSPKPLTKAVSFVPPGKIPKAVLSKFTTKHPRSVPTSHLAVSL